ncbi:MAG: hypothetical protein PHP00_08060 [Thiotrichaceae bacterium]|nr:hypothetical protein [Thiotrichaceae bacterium]
MTTVFISGSREIRILTTLVRDRLQNIVNQQFSIVVGDANGADKAVQKYLAEINYTQVSVYYAGSLCRNNLGNWHVESIQVDAKLKGRDFYTQKDKAMAAQADYGFVLWDGKSIGSFNNINELLSRNKKVLVYFTPEQTFIPMSKSEDIQKFSGKSALVPTLVGNSVSFPNTLPLSLL